MQKKITIAQAQYTLEQFFIEVIENKKEFQPYDVYRLLIDPKFFGLSKADNQSENIYFSHVIDCYIFYAQGLQSQAFTSNPDEFSSIRKINRILNRLVNVLTKHKTKYFNSKAPDWAVNFHMPIYGIDKQRELSAIKKQERINQSENHIQQAEPITAKDLICRVEWYEMQQHQPTPFSALTDTPILQTLVFTNENKFIDWCNSESIKDKNILLQSINNGYVFNQIYINANGAVQHLREAFASANKEAKQ